MQPLPFRYGFKAERGLRGGMEDELHVESVDGYLYAGCYDGHGGTAAAQWLRANLMSTLTAHVQAQPQGVSVDNPQIPQGLYNGFIAADKELLLHLESMGGDEQSQAGSTATAIMLWPNRVVAANVGDSQAYLWRKNNLVSLTTPHRVYGPGPEVEVEVARVKSTGGWVYDGRVCNVLAVSRAFGDWEFKGKGLKRMLSAGVERGYWPASFPPTIHFTSDPVIVTPDASDTPLTEDDEFLVTSTDGLWDVMEPREAMQWARKEFQKGLDPEQVAESLVKIALKRHTTDNTSVVVVDLKGADYWKAAGKKGGGFSFGKFW